MLRIFDLVDENGDKRVFIDELAGFNLALTSIRLGNAAEVASKEFSSAAGGAVLLDRQATFQAAHRRDDTAFDIADSNHDGSLSLSEYNTYRSPATSIDVRKAHAARFLSERDVDGDGYISLWEFLDRELLVKEEGESR